MQAHITLKLMDRCRIRPPHDVERDGLVRIAAEAADLKVVVARIERVAEGRRGLRRSLEREHALVPGVAGELVGFPTRFRRALGRYADRCAVKPVAGFGAHGGENVPAEQAPQAASI